MARYSYKIVGDTHVEEDALEELDKIFLEIMEFESENLIFLGDIFHKNNPTPKEIDFVMRWFKKFQTVHKSITVILGNHDLYAGFQTTSLLRHLGVEVSGDSKCNYTTPLGTFLLGHFFVNESIFNYAENTSSIATLAKDFKYVFLGHQHRFQKLAGNAWHLGSIRYVNFSEYEEPLMPKQILLIDQSGTLTFQELKSPYILKQFSSVDELYECYKRLANQRFCVITDKIRLKYIDFDTYKTDINKLDAISKTLPVIHPIKIKLDFEGNIKLVKQYDTELRKQQLTTDEVVKRWLDSITDKDVKEILQEESKNLCN
jgi:DNA repair exonuclease SbcCD nuclease subunit